MKRLQVNLLSCVVAAMLIPLLLTTAVVQAQLAPARARPGPWGISPT